LTIGSTCSSMVRGVDCPSWRGPWLAARWRRPGGRDAHVERGGRAPSDSADEPRRPAGDQCLRAVAAHSGSTRRLRHRASMGPYPHSGAHRPGPAHHPSSASVDCGSVVLSTRTRTRR
jgi:hypothetical protein